MDASYTLDDAIKDQPPEDLLRIVLPLLSQHSAFLNAVSLDQLVTFIQLIRHLKPRLAWNQASHVTEPPPSLPVSIYSFLRDALQADGDSVKALWLALKNSLWDEEGMDVEHKSAALLPLFLKHGLPYGIGFYEFFPPHRTCMDPNCRRVTSENESFAPELSDGSTYPATLLTHRYGALPVFTTSFYCRSCNTRYYHNYRVHSEASLRTYYSGMPAVIQVSQRFFIESSLCEIFATMMNCAWTSATNCARIYNLSFAPQSLKSLLPENWHVKLTLYTEDVWDAFYIHALLLDHSARNSILHLPHQCPTQAERLRPALEIRNERMMGPGQDHWAHACNKCTHVFETDEGMRVIRSAVTDGITLGHPCCAGEIDCKNPLSGRGSLFCAEHSWKSTVCAVTTCENIISPGFRTCILPEHRKFEERYTMAGKAMFQLKARLVRNKVTHTNNSLAGGEEVTSEVVDAADDSNEGTGLDDDAVLVDENGDITSANNVDAGTIGLDGADLSQVKGATQECTGKAETGNVKLRARFGRKRTHNEELCVTSCGIILGRATFYGSEAPNGVREFWKGLFPTQASLPNVMWMDNNCKISQMLAKQGDTYFKNCALPVDVFHFKCKHKASDEWCAQNCNPALWPDLMVDGKWRFSSSAAEQMNEWFGGFLSIVREMRRERYNFFLDEMIRRRNIILVAELEAKGTSPYLIPREDLLGENL